MERRVLSIITGKGRKIRESFFFFYYARGLLTGTRPSSLHFFVTNDKDASFVTKTSNELILGKLETFEELCYNVIN